MDVEGDNPDLRSEEGNRGNGTCNCTCQAENILLRAEIKAMKILLDRYRINENSEVNPPAKKAKLDDKADEVKGHSSAQIVEDVDIDSSGKEAATHAALLNVDILCHLGSFLSVNDLLECRRVCKTWNTAASLNLRTRSTYLTEYIEDIPGLFYAARRNPKFPFVGYQWYKFYKGQEEVMGEFLSEFGHVFKRLRLRYSFLDFSFATSLTEFLSTYFSHVEVLDISTLYSPEKPMSPKQLEMMSSQLEKLCLPELKRLILPSATHDDPEIQAFVGDLVKVCPNLQRIDDLTPGLAKALVPTGKMNSVTTMTFKWCDVPEPYAAVTVSPPCHLTHLEIEELVEWRYEAELQNVIWNAFVAVLTASRGTLKYLKLNDLGAQLKDLPVFPRLKHLHVQGNAMYFRGEGGTYRLFPENVSNAFPVLTEVTVEVFGCSGDDRNAVRQNNILKFFLWDEPVLSVKSLNICFAFDKHGMEFLRDIFPKVTQMCIDWETCFRQNGPNYRSENFWDVWTVPFRLERLEINRLNPWTRTDFSLDSFLTGIPESVCRNLRQQKYAEHRVDSCYSDLLRGRPSMLNFKDSLSELVISIDYPPTRESQLAMAHDSEHHRPTLSSVSTLYGIQRMKSLFVYLAYDHRKSYSSCFKDFFAPATRNVIVCHKEFEDPTLQPQLVL